MPSFRDNQDRTWQVEVNCSTVKRVRSLLNVDLLEVVGGDLLQKLQDPILLCDVLFVLCKPEAELLGIDSEAFGRGLCGDSIANASRALLEAISDFSPSRKDRQNLKAVLTAMEELKDRISELVARRIESGVLKKQAEALALDAMRSSGSAPESSDSILDLSLSENCSAWPGVESVPSGAASPA